MPIEQLNLFEPREDSATVAHALTAYRQTTSFRNNMTGLGTERDPNSYFEIVNTSPLEHNERINLYRNSQISRNIVNVYPEEASWVKILGVKPALALRISNYLENLRTGSLEMKVREASIEARLHGESWLLLGINDQQRFTQPINELNIQSLEWVEIFTYDQIHLSTDNPNIYEITLIESQGNPDAIERQSTDTNYRGEKKLLVHRSRLVKFVGNYLPPSVKKQTKKHDSSLQAAFDGLSIWMQGLMASNAMMGDHSLFWYKLDGLANLVRAKKTDELYSRFLTLQMSKSVLKGIALDAKNEDAGFITRNYSGVKDILRTMLDYLVAETGMVRYKILGSSQDAGLGGEGRGIQERLQHSLNLRSWQRFCWKDNFNYIYRLVLLAKDSPTKGRIPRGYSLTFPPVLELSPEEIAELMNKNVSWGKAAVESQLLNKLEARNSLFGDIDSILDPHVIVDPRVTEMMEDELQQMLEDAGVNSTAPNAEIDEPDPVTENDDPIDTTEGRLGIQDSELAARIDEIQNIEAWREYIDEEEGVWKEDGSYPFLVWFSDRGGKNKHRTPIAVRVTASNEKQARSKAVTAARKKCQRHCEVATNIRQPTESEKKTAASGNWIRTGPKGEKSGYKGVRGVGPALKKQDEDGIVNKSDDKEENRQEIDGKIKVTLTNEGKDRINKALEILADVDETRIRTETE